LQVNEGIRAREVRLVDVSGQQLGIMPTREALRISRERQLDLVVVAPNAKPPVCRIMDYGKYKYEQSKREKEARKKQKVITVKEVRLRPNIDQHDLEVKLKNVRRFLAGGDKVKVIIRFRGRQIAYTDAGKKLLNDIAEEVKELGTVEKGAKVEGKQMTMIIAPKQDKPEKQAEKKQPQQQEKEGVQ
jgi:translation initiation factor IF-3